jgi:hypothetical protein
LQVSPGNSLSVDKNAELIPAVLQNVLAAFRKNRGAISGDAAIGNRELIAHVASADRERRSCQGHGAARVFRGNELDNRFAGCSGIWHKGDSELRLYHHTPGHSHIRGFKLARDAQFFAATSYSADNRIQDIPR